MSLRATERARLRAGRSLLSAGLLAVLWLAAACSSDGAGDNSAPADDVSAGSASNSDDESGTEPSEPPASPGAIAATEFVSAAIRGQQPDAYFASSPAGDEQLGVPFDPELLSARLGELQALERAVSSVVPSASAYPDAGEDLAPSCTMSTGLLCQADLLGPADDVVASVIVYTFGDGVTDFSILQRAADGTVTGIGEADCGPGFDVHHGGQLPERFDIAVCVDATGAVQYNGQERGTDNGITLVACQLGSRRWEATNEGFRYVVDGSTSPVRTVLEVFDPSGELILGGPMSSVHLPATATPEPC